MKLCRLAGLWSGISLLFLHALVWACAPQPLVVHTRPAPEPVSAVSPDQWLLQTQIHLLVVNGHFLNQAHSSAGRPLAVLTDITDDLSAQASWLTSIATPMLPILMPGAIRPISKAIRPPGVMDASPQIGVPRLPPRA
jgi:hypothetical protein